MLKRFNDLPIGQVFNLPTSPYSSPATKLTYVKVTESGAKAINNSQQTITVNPTQFCKVRDA